MDCNLELGLSPSSTSISSTASTISTGSIGDNLKEGQMTIFYNGKICVCDVTEAQAKCVINLASGKTTEGMCKSPATTGRADLNITFSSQQSQRLPQTSLSRSLRQFLEKRKHRIQATSPYHL
ncbi:protein TIFY 5A-like [Chenopodium quinoa]|uniref:protein TIFY 5A-like n=1 Tax=Chenopodium quinoa TaxID=63459 RepID=UPI000B781FBD|nr:protein TIFY 5A-like [Chenopodium quinoa]